MEFRIELRRAGMSRVSERAIPLVARILTDTGYGRDLLAGDKLTDVECAKAQVEERLARKFGRGVAIRWIDATRERTMDEEAAAECGGLMERS